MSFRKENLEEIARTALEAATSSGDILMKYWGEHQNGRLNMGYSPKEDFSPVTGVDYEVERNIRSIVLSDYPQHRILGEEYGEEGSERSPYLWIVDPIDGTKQYVRGLRYFATQLAVMYENEVVVGVSNAPALNETIVAVKNRGAFLNNRTIHVSKVSYVQDCFISHGNIKYFSKTKRLRQLVKLCEHSWANRGFGDFWSYHLLASGRIDAMIEAETNIWDIAAASIIVEEAGGRATDFEGIPISFDSSSIIATNNLIHSEVLKFFNDGCAINEQEV